MKPDLSDFIRLGIGVVFMGLLVFGVVTGGGLDDFVKDQLVVVIAFYFGLDRAGDVIGKAIIQKKTNIRSAAIEKGVEDVTDL